MLTVDGPEQLLSAQPAQWEVLRKASKEEVSLRCAGWLELIIQALLLLSGYAGFGLTDRPECAPIRCIWSSSMLQSTLCIRTHQPSNACLL